MKETAKGYIKHKRFAYHGDEDSRIRTIHMLGSNTLRAKPF